MGNKNTTQRATPGIDINHQPANQENLLTKFKYLLGQNQDQVPGQISDTRSETSILLSKFKHLLGQNQDQVPDQNPDQVQDQNPDQVQDQVPDQNPDQVQDQVPYQNPDQSSDTGSETSILLTKFKHLIQSDDVEDYIAEVSTYENDKVTEKSKRIKIGDFTEASWPK